MIETNILNLCTIKARIGWQGLRSDEFLSNGTYSLVTGTDIKDGTVDWSNTYYVSKERYEQDKSIQLRLGDILISKDGTIGKVGYVSSMPNRATLNSGVFVVRSKNQSVLRNDFLSWFFKSRRFDDYITELRAGSTISHLYQKDFVKLTVFYPQSTQEQRRIAAALGDVDGLISELDALIEKKRAVMQGAMQQLLTARRRLPGYSAPWVTRRLKELVSMNSGGTPSTSEPAYYNGDIPFLSISDITATPKYLSATAKHISKLALDNSSARLYRAGTLFLSMYASIGKVCISTVDVAISQAILGLIPLDEGSIDMDFLYYALAFCQKELADSGQTGTQSNLNKRIVQNFAVTIPTDTSEQHAIATVLSDMDAELEELAGKRGKYAAVRRGMMQQLLTGKIRLI